MNVLYTVKSHKWEGRPQLFSFFLLIMFFVFSSSIFLLVFASSFFYFASNFPLQIVVLFFILFFSTFYFLFFLFFFFSFASFSSFRLFPSYLHWSSIVFLQLHIGKTPRKHILLLDSDVYQLQKKYEQIFNDAKIKVFIL